MRDVVLLAMLLVASPGFASAAGDEEDPSAIVRRWARRMDLLESRYRSIHIDATLTLEADAPGTPRGEAPSSIGLALDAIPTALRLEVRRRSKGEGDATQSRAIHVETATECFSVYPDATGTFVLQRLGRPGSIVSDMIQGYSSMAVFHRPFSYATTLSVAQLLRSPSFTARGVRSERAEGTDRVDVIDFDLAPGPDNHDLGLVGSLRFSTERGGVFSGFDIEFRKKVNGHTTRFSGEISYRDADGGLPIPSRVRLVQRESLDRSTLTRTFDITGFEPAEFDPKPFTLAAFGLGELASPLSARRSGATPWWIGTGVAFLLISLVFRHTGRRAAAA